MDRGPARANRSPKETWTSRSIALAVTCLWLCAAGPVFAQAAEVGSRPTIRVLTWNALAPSPAERLLGLLVDTGAADRGRALLREAKALDPDILAFQEVTSGFMQVLGDDPGWADHHTSASGPKEPPGGLLVLSRYPFAKIAYRRLPSPSGRYALFATLDLGDEALVVANVHLESPLEDHAARKAQLEFVEERLLRSRLTVWLGDFNFDDRDPEAGHISRWTDAWTCLRPGEAGHTYDIDANPLAADNAFSAEPSRRIDRILTSTGLAPIAAGLTGQTDPPSDHYGVWADLQPRR